jgi:hypothetical protein
VSHWRLALIMFVTIKFPFDFFTTKI